MSQIIIENAHTWRLTGELTFVTVANLLSEFTQLATKAPPQLIDLQAVTRTDSAGLALLIELVRRTQENPIRFRHIPPQMLSIATVSGVQEIVTHATTDN